MKLQPACCLSRLLVLLDVDSFDELTFLLTLFLNFFLQNSNHKHPICRGVFVVFCHFLYIYDERSYFNR
jgi:hypothetical protein